VVCGSAGIPENNTVVLKYVLYIYIYYCVVIRRVVKRYNTALSPKLEYNVQFLNE